MKKLSPETIEKLEWLKGRLRKYPHRYDQKNWCGTQGCLVGYCMPRIRGIRGAVLSDKRAIEEFGSNFGAGFCEAARLAERWLRLNFNQSEKLFESYWYGDAQQFNRLPTDTDEQAAEKACRRIDLFIQSGGTQ